MSDKTVIFYDAVIIGGGAAGLMCAVLTKKFNSELKVCIAESQDRVGRKLLVTGNGRCNLTNVNITPEMYHGSFSYCVKELLCNCPPQKIIEIFEEMGLMTTQDSEGRVYPLSKQANSVLDTLRKTSVRYGVDIITSCKVTDITHHKGKYSLRTDKGKILANKIIIATGSKASPATGANDSMLKVLEGMGHTIISASPSLCPVTVKSPYLKSLKGVRVNARVSIIAGDRIIKEEVGELQFAENALSGICVFNLSRIANTFKDTRIKVSLLPQLNDEELFSKLKHKALLMCDYENAEELLVGYFHKMVGIALLKESGISPADSIRNISDDKIEALAKAINNWNFTVVPHGDFSKAQVAAGGVSGREIDMHTMESLLHKNLYIIGEATDCDGDCGGMNLQFAFSSAYAAAKDISKL